MRLSEKTLELTFCSQLSLRSGRLMTWFGLTQREEARAGFDACTSVNGVALFFQFKASNRITSNGSRRFIAPHQQMSALRNLSGAGLGPVYYVFPMIGNTHELSQSPDVLSKTWLLDAAGIPNLSWPTTRAGNPRKSGWHYVDVYPPIATIHSQPEDVSVIQATELAASASNMRRIESGNFAAWDEFDEIRKRLGRHTYMAIIQ